MKTIRNYSLMVLCCITWACHKDLPDPPKPVTIFHTVTILPADGVTITPILPNNSTKVEDGKPFSMDLNSGPNKRYKVLSNGVVVADYRTGSFYYLVPSVNTDLNLQIVSEAVTFTVTASAGIGGTVTPLSTTVEYGSDLPLNIVENAEYTLTSIKVNGVSVAITKPYVLKNITANSDVQVGFTLTNILIITNGADDKSRPWMWTHWDMYDENHVFEGSVTLTQEQLAWKVYYYSNGIGVSWNILPGNILTSGDQIYTIVELTDKKFVFEQKGEFTLGKIEYMRRTYERQ